MLCLAALVAAVSAQYGHGGHGGHGHGVGYSSQHIARHDGPAHVVHVQGHDGHGHGHGHGHGSIDYYVSNFDKLLSTDRMKHNPMSEGSNTSTHRVANTLSSFPQQ